MASEGIVSPAGRAKVVLFANTDWYLFNFRRSLALSLQAEGLEVLLLSPPGPYGQRLLDLGLRWQPVPMKRSSLNPIREIALLAHLVRLLRRERPALVHSFTIKCAVYGSLAARLAGIPARVNAVAGMGYVFTSDHFKARLLRPMVRSLLRLAMGGRQARLVLQNPDDVALFAKAGLVDPNRVRLIQGSGVDTVRFSPDSTRCWPLGSRMRVLLPARLLWDKGIAEFVEAARILLGQERKIDFLLAGEPDPGNPAAIPVERIRAWEAGGLLEWLGQVEDMPALLRSVDVVALPSYREGLPKGLIEAGASGLALVTTDVPGCRQVVSHAVDGLLVPVRNAAALAEAIAQLHDDPALARRLGDAARIKAVAEFDQALVNDRTRSVYRELQAASA